MRWVVVVLLVLAVAAAAVVYTSRGYETAMVIPTGDGAGMVAARVGDAEQASVCPLGIDAADGEQLVLVDLAGSKVLTLDVPSSGVRENALDIDPSVIVEGVLYDEGSLFAWGQDASGATHSIDALSLNDAGVYAVDSGGGFLDNAPAMSVDGQRRMEALGYVPEDETGFLGSVNRLRSPTRVVTEQWDDSVDQDEGVINVDFLRSGDEDVEFRVNAPDGRVIRGVYVLEGDLVSARVFRRNIPGRVALVISESRLTEAGLAFAQSVILVELTSGEATLFRLPTGADEICQPKQNLTITESGAVYTISVAADEVRINRLTPVGPFVFANFALSRAFENLSSPPVIEPSQAADASNPEAPAPATPQTPAALPAPVYTEVAQGQNIDRRAVIENACLYLNHNWTMGEANYALTGRPEPWRRPRRLDGQIGLGLRGLPYAWGGADRLTDFDRKISLGRPAGDVCTPRCGGNVVRDERGEVNGVFTAGVDCSGFVLRSWGWRGARHTTSSLKDITTPIALEDLRPGDVLNNAGSHVRLFVAWQGPGHIEVIESAVSCGGVCRHVLPLDQFRGYVPRRPVHVPMDETITYQDINAICDPQRLTPIRSTPSQ